LIDLGYIGNFISLAFIKRYDIRTRLKKEPFPLISFNGKPVTYNNGIISRETQQLPLSIGRYTEKTQFNITDTPGCDIVLGLLWLIESNPTINWSKGIIQFRTSLSTLIRKVRDISHKIDVHAISAIELREAIVENLDQVQVLD
jgi:hypothetical protein